jgi:hypothetical protein
VTKPELDDLNADPEFRALPLPERQKVVRALQGGSWEPRPEPEPEAEPGAERGAWSRALWSTPAETAPQGPPVPEAAAPTAGVEAMYGGAGEPTAEFRGEDPAAAFAHQWAPTAALTGAAAILGGAPAAIARGAGFVPAATRLGGQAIVGGGTETAREVIEQEPWSPRAITVAGALEAATGLPGKVARGVAAVYRRRPKAVLEAEHRAAELARGIPGKVREIVPKFRGLPEKEPAYEAAETAMKAAPGTAVPMGRTVTAIDKALKDFPAESGAAGFDTLRDASMRLRDTIARQSPDPGEWRLALDQFSTQSDILWERIKELPKGSPSRGRLLHIYGELQDGLADAAKAAPKEAAARLKLARDSNVMHLASDKLGELISEGLPLTTEGLTPQTTKTLAKTIRKNADLKRWLGREGLDAVVSELESIRLIVPKEWRKGKPLAEEAATIGGAIVAGPKGAALGAAYGPIRRLTPELIEETWSRQTGPFARLVTSAVLNGLARRPVQERFWSEAPAPEEPEPPGRVGLTPELTR